MILNLTTRKLINSTTRNATKTREYSPDYTIKMEAQSGRAANVRNQSFFLKTTFTVELRCQSGSIVAIVECCSSKYRGPRVFDQQSRINIEVGMLRTLVLCHFELPNLIVNAGLYF